MTQEFSASRDVIGVTAWSVHVPHFDPSVLTGGPASRPACDAEHAHEVLGRKGLLGKDAATRLALCAVHRALACKLGHRPAPAEDPTTAVVASSNFGNYETIARIARVLDKGSVREISAMDAPNASSNIVASSVAIWFGLGGPNLMVCSGATSGLDAVELGCSLLRAGRAQRVVVVAVEPDDAVAARFQAMRTRGQERQQRALHAAAAAVVLQLGASTGMPVLEYVELIDSPEACNKRFSTRLVGPGFLAGDGRHVTDIDEALGDTFGARGVLQLAIALELIVHGQGAAKEMIDVVSGDGVDGWRHARILKRSKG